MTSSDPGRTVLALPPAMRQLGDSLLRLTLQVRRAVGNCSRRLKLRQRLVWLVLAHIADSDTDVRVGEIIGGFACLYRLAEIRDRFLEVLVGLVEVPDGAVGFGEQS